MDLNITPVATQLKPPQSMSLADMINVGRGGIALKKEKQADTERVGLQDFFSNPENFQTDGNIDMTKVNAAIPKIAPLTGRDVLKNVADLSTAQTQANKAKQGLTQDQKALVGQTFNILGKAGVNNRDTYLKALDDLVATNPNNPDLGRLADSYKTIWGKMPENTNFAQLAISGAQTLMPIASQESQFNPQSGTIGTGAATFQTVNRPSVAGQNPNILVAQTPLATNQLGPGARYVPTGRVDMNNNPTALAYGPNGELLGEMVIPAGANPAMQPGQNVFTPGGGQPTMGQPQTGVQGGGVMPQNNIQASGGPVVGGPMPLPAVTAQPLPAVGQPQPAPALPANAPVRMPPGENATTLEAATNLRLKTRELAQQVGVQQFNSDQIIKLADDVISGKGAGTIANLTGGYAGLNGLGIGGKNATNLQQLGHYMALQTQALTAGTGLGNTDAGRAIGGQIAGDIQWTPEAIKQTARVNRALSTGTELFAQGVDNAFTRSKGNPFAAAEFQQRWSTALGNDGINAIRLYDAIRKKDNEAIKEVVTQAGGANSAGYQNLVNKIGQMQKLIGGK
jgi:hypothetical protein